MPADRPTCATCKWFGEAMYRSEIGRGFPEENDGSCRKALPSMNASGWGTWPNVTRNDWCGEHAPVAVEPKCANHPDRVTTYDLWKGMHLCDECWIGKDPYA